MEAFRFLSIFLALVTLSCLLSSCDGYKFYVGGRDGWVLSPSENYNHWAGRMRFQVNDTLYFKYKKGTNSVLVVDKDDYYSCNVDKPILRLEDGNSTFVFNRSGPFFFISGNDTNCAKGQKLIIVVLALSHSHFQPPPISHSPAAPPTVGKAPAPGKSPASSPGKSPVSAQSPLPSAHPVTAPSPAPMITAPTPVVSAPPPAPPSSIISPSGSAPPGATSPPGSSPSGNTSGQSAPAKNSARQADVAATGPAMILLSLITLWVWV